MEINWFQAIMYLIGALASYNLGYQRGQRKWAK